jgi:hypothetical protein
MSSRNDESSGAVFAFVFVATAILIVAAIIFALAAFAALVLTVLCIFAWKDGLTIGEFSIEAHEARAFVLRGVLGAIILPAFAVFTALLFGEPISDDAWSYIFIGGYTLGSVGIEYLISQQETPAQPPTPIVPPRQITPPPASDHMPIAPPARPFEYASWDDEDIAR